MFFLADLHFSHKNVIKFTTRPFEDVAEMDEALIQIWNQTVGADDTVYHLGDFCFGRKSKWESILERLNGSIILIKGNHDSSKIARSLLAGGLIKEYHPIGTGLKVDNYILYLTHFPMLIGCRPRLFSIHGHVHGEDLMMPDCINVGVDSQLSKMFGHPFGRPIHIDELMPVLHKAEAAKRPQSCDELS